MEHGGEVRYLENNRYHLTHVLGQGGMATVYRAHDRRLDTFRAVKMLLPEYARNINIRRRFEMEARTTAKLHHANIVTVHDVSIDGDNLFIVMELITGGCLMDRVRDIGPLPPKLAVRTMAQVLDGLHYAHENRVIHRDIKPHNIMITSSEIPKLADFGIAHVSNTQAEMTRTGSVMGTWAYMAPEQRASARQVDARSDVYACTATLFALVTGQEPFDLFAQDAHAALFAAMPASLASVIRKGSAYLQDGRHASAEDLKQALEDILPDLPEDPEGHTALASSELVERFERGSLSGMASQPFQLSNPRENSSPTFETESLAIEDRDVSSGRFVHLDDSIVRESSDGTSTANSGLRSKGAKIAVLLLICFGLGLFVTVAMIAMTIRLLGQAPVADIAEVNANATVETLVESVEKAEVKVDQIATEDGGDSIDPKEANVDPADVPEAPATATTNPVIEPEPTVSPPVAPAPVAPPVDNSKEEDATPTGKLRVRCLPGCKIVIKSKVSAESPPIRANDSFRGDVPLGNNVVRLTPVQGEPITKEILVLKTQSPIYCWDFQTGSRCSKDAK